MACDVLTGGTGYHAHLTPRGARQRLHVRLALCSERASVASVLGESLERRARVAGLKSCQGPALRQNRHSGGFCLSAGPSA